MPHYWLSADGGAFVFWAKRKPPLRIHTGEQIRDSVGCMERETGRKSTNNKTSNQPIRSTAESLWGLRAKARAT